MDYCKSSCEYFDTSITTTGGHYCKKYGKIKFPEDKCEKINYDNILFNNLRYIIKYYRPSVMLATNFSNKILDRIENGELIPTPEILEKIAGVVCATKKQLLTENLDVTTPHLPFCSVKVGEFFYCRYGDHLHLKISPDEAFDFEEGKIITLNKYDTQVRRTGVAKVVLVDEEEWTNNEDIYEVDWSKVPKDTPILVWDKGKYDKFRRYFAKYKDGILYAYAEGLTSWTTDTVVQWDCAELADPELKYMRKR